MITRQSRSPKQDIKLFVRHWFKLLAAGKIEEACQLLDEPNCYGIRWTPTKLKEAVDLAFAPESRFRREHPEGLLFSDPDEIPPEPGRWDIIALDDRNGYSGDFDVPMNGVWSDLTAQFEFLKRPKGLAVILHDLHVL